MKQCPNCSRTYSDDTLVFCLDDGAKLVGLVEPPETLRIAVPRATDWPVTPSPSPVHQEPQRRTRWPIYVLVSLLAIGLICGVVGVAVFGYWKISASSPAAKTDQQDDEPRESPVSPTPAASPTPRTSASLVGSWRTNVTENKQLMEITVTFSSQGNTRYLFKDAKGRTATDTGTWQYSDGILFERFSNGSSGRSSSRWIDDDTVELTIIDNGVPAYAGLKRFYRRIR